MSTLVGDTRDRLIAIERRLDEIEACRPASNHVGAGPMTDSTRDRLIDIETRLDELETRMPIDDHSVAKDTPMEDFKLSTYLEAAGFSIPTFGDMQSIWLAHSASLVLKMGNYAGTKDLTALAAILKHMLGDDGLRKVCNDIQRFLEMKENP